MRCYLFRLMLVGDELLAFVKANEGVPQIELVEHAGYVKEVRGKKRLMKKAFTDALLKAKGVYIAPKPRRGKPAANKTAVHKNGIILLGRSYSERFNARPGDLLEILVMEDHIKLIPISKAA